jgi:precorrin-4/cobalt-precorrin-4 C11-methyltransferase
MNLQDVISVYESAKKDNLDVARVHTGDTSIFSSVSEQICELNKREIAWEIIPGVSSFSAAAMVLGKEFTLPEVTQTVILTRFEGRTSVPEKERLSSLAEHHSTLIIFLSVGMIGEVVLELSKVYLKSDPVAVVYKASWLNKIIRGTLENIEEMVSVRRSPTALIVVGKISARDPSRLLKLYDVPTHEFEKVNSMKVLVGRSWRSHSF